MRLSNKVFSRGDFVGEDVSSKVLLEESAQPINSEWELREESSVKTRRLPL